MFKLEPVGNRSWADCGDIVNWLLDKSIKIAEEFEAKYKHAEEEMKQERKLAS